MKFPISAVLPIYNCEVPLRRHLKNVALWASSVQEIIVVDSGSTDGSLEQAREELNSFGARFIHNPPGLYQSWNAGIAAATSPWCYISTVEDPISLEGLNHLFEVITRYDADVVISPPEMRNQNGVEPVEEKMPSNRLSDSFLNNAIADRLLTRSETIALLCGFLPHGILGSSASNLYRTSLIQKQPFPEDFGHCGDTAWGVTVSPVARIAFTPKECAQFYCQTSFRPENPTEQLLRHRRLADLARSSLMAHASFNPEVAVMLGWFTALDHSTELLWNWLSEQHTYQKNLQAKYEGGIISYLTRAFCDEWKKLCS